MMRKCFTIKLAEGSIAESTIDEAKLTTVNSLPKGLSGRLCIILSDLRSLENIKEIEIADNINDSQFISSKKETFRLEDFNIKIRDQFNEAVTLLRWLYYRRLEEYLEREGYTYEHEQGNSNKCFFCGMGISSKFDACGSHESRETEMNEMLYVF